MSLMAFLSVQSSRSFKVVLAQSSVVAIRTSAATRCISNVSNSSFGSRAAAAASAPQNQVRRQSSENNAKVTASATSTAASTAASSTTAAEKHQAYMKEANAQMQSYHEARELMKQGKLPSANNNNNNTNNKRGGGPPNNATVAQAGVFCLFLAAFMATPFLGKKIATDDAFRQKWVPAWYDYTVKKPEHAWTREELHEQMLQVQQDVHERAIRGEFAPDKLRELQNAMQSPYASSSYGHNNNQGGLDRSKIPKEWDKIHPGLDDNENLDESDD